MRQTEDAAGRIARPVIHLTTVAFKSHCLDHDTTSPLPPPLFNECCCSLVIQEHKTLLWSNNSLNGRALIGPLAAPGHIKALQNLWRRTPAKSLQLPDCWIIFG